MLVGTVQDLANFVQGTFDAPRTDRTRLSVKNQLKELENVDQAADFFLAIDDWNGAQLVTLHPLVDFVENLAFMS